MANGVWLDSLKTDLDVMRNYNKHIGTYAESVFMPLVPRLVPRNTSYDNHAEILGSYFELHFIFKMTQQHFDAK